MKSNPVGWFEIYVDDLPRAKRFYEAVFERPLTRLPAPGIEMWAFDMDMNANGAGGALVHMPGFRAGANSVIIYFNCEDCAVEGARAANAGGQFSGRRCPSANTASSCWSKTPKAI